MKVYIDTNVYLDYFLERRNAKKSFRIFRKALRCDFFIIISDHALNELIRYIEPKNVRFFFATLNHKLIKVYASEEDKLEAKNISTHYEDALHIVLAKKSEADIIITNNIKDFKGLFNSKIPEDV